MVTATRHHTTDLTSRTHDVVIVGARCAGAATALLLARAGPRRRRGRPRRAAERHALDPLDRPQRRGPAAPLGPARRGVGLRGAADPRAWSSTPTAVGDAHGQGPRRRRPPGGAPPPRARHASSPTRPSAAGATLRTGVTRDRPARDADGRVTGRRRPRTRRAGASSRARVVVGADGLRSRVARAVGAPRDATTAAQRRHLLRLLRRRGQWDGGRVLRRPPALAACSPPTAARRASGRACPHSDAAPPARRRPAPTRRSTACSPRRPQLADRLRAGAPHIGRSRAPPACPTRSGRPAGPGWALVGDAGYHRDPITGHGISDAFRDAELLADALDDALARRPTRGRCPGRLRAAGATARPRDIFDLTCALGAFPPPDRFVELQRQLSQAIDDRGGRPGRPPDARSGRSWPDIDRSHPAGHPGTNRRRHT